MFSYADTFALTLISFLICDDGDEPSDNRIYLSGVVVTKGLREENGVKNSYILKFFLALDKSLLFSDLRDFNYQKGDIFITLSSPKNENVGHSIIDCFEPEKGFFFYEPISLERGDDEATEIWKRNHYILHFSSMITESYIYKVNEEYRIYRLLDISSVTGDFIITGAKKTSKSLYQFDISKSTYGFNIFPSYDSDRDRTMKTAEKIDKSAFDTAFEQLKKFKQEYLDTIEGRNKEEENLNDATNSTNDSLIPTKPLGETQKDVENRSLSKHVGFILVLVFFVIAAIIFLFICLKTKAKKYVAPSSGKKEDIL